MDEKEYLQTLGEQIVNPHARASVLAEIQDHIEEQAQDYRASGMSEAVAMQEAVRQMGDPVSTGEALNQVHRPKFPIALFGLAVVLTVLGIAMQYLVYTHLTPDTAILSDTYLQRTILYNAIGLGSFCCASLATTCILQKAHGFFWQSFYLVCYRHGSSAFTVGSTPSATIWHWSIRWYMPCCYTGYGTRGQKPFGSCTD